MPTEVLPIRELGTVGLVQDTPAVSLPPNVFTNVENVRFRDGAVRKMEGEGANLISSLANVVYVAFWPAPTNDYWVIVDNTGDIDVYNTTDLVTPINVGSMSITGTPKWNHTLFNGGFNFVINNGVSTPMFLSDPVAANSLSELPN